MSTRRRLLLGLAAMAASPTRAALVDVIVAAKRSVGAVGTFSAVNSPRFSFRGTGFVVGDGNQLITNAHVLPEATAMGDGKSALVVQFGTGSGTLEVRQAVVAASDGEHDLALLRFEGGALPALRLADAKDTHEGLSVAFIGYPIGGVLGFRPVTHRGIISSITAVALPPPNSQLLNERTARRLRQGSFDIYQLDATAFPGNSGGPVLDVETGNVVGVINMVLVRATKESALSHPTGITYAIPATFIDALVRGR